MPPVTVADDNLPMASSLDMPLIQNNMLGARDATVRLRLVVFFQHLLLCSLCAEASTSSTALQMLSVTKSQAALPLAFTCVTCRAFSGREQQSCTLSCTQCLQCQLVNRGFFSLCVFMPFFCPWAQSEMLAAKERRDQPLTLKRCLESQLFSHITNSHKHACVCRA